jgi:hypothetical protein
MGPDRTEQDTAKGSAEGKEPIAPPPAHRARRAPDQVRRDHPHLLGEEDYAQRTMLLQVAPQGGLREEGGAGGSDEVQRDPDVPVRPRRPVCPQSTPPAGGRRRDRSRFVASQISMTRSWQRTSARRHNYSQTTRRSMSASRLN